MFREAILTTLLIVCAVPVLAQQAPITIAVRDHPIVARAATRVQDYQRLTGTNLRAVLAANLTDLGTWVVQQLTQMAGQLLLGRYAGYR